ncbi:MAG: hypothetical protein WCR30_03420 [Clostridia bacterium]
MANIFENDYDLEELKEEFSLMREQVDMRLKKDNFSSKIKEEKFFTVLDEIIHAAEDGDIVAQDYIAYLYKRGYDNFIPVSVKIYMEWSIMAAANGNKFTIEKLMIFLTSAVNEVCAVDDFEQIVKKNELYIENYEYIIGRLFCQAIVDYLSLDIKKMIKSLTTSVNEDEEVELRVFNKAREAVLPKVLEFLRG